jgi:septum site-determining protein MinC
MTVALDLKSSRLSALVLPLRTRDLAALRAAYEAQWGQLAGAFEGDPLVLDVSELPAQGVALDWPVLLGDLRRYGLQPVALQGAEHLPEPEREAARGVGLCLSEVGAAPSHAEAAQPVPEPVAPAGSVVPTGSRCVLIDRPVRSGQRIYARDADLVVLGLVSNGAEVIADGNVHVYGALRGRAIAGAKGNAEARVFTQSLEAELLAVAGTFRTSEKPLPPEVAGKPAMVRLEGERLIFEPLKY